MQVSWAGVLLLAVGMALLFWLGRLLVTGRGWRFLLHAILGVATLLLAQSILSGVVVNLWTLLVSTALGIPGAVLCIFLPLLL